MKLDNKLNSKGYTMLMVLLTFTKYNTKHISGSLSRPGGQVKDSNHGAVAGEKHPKITICFGRKFTYAFTFSVQRRPLL